MVTPGPCHCEARSRLGLPLPRPSSSAPGRHCCVQICARPSRWRPSLRTACRTRCARAGKACPRCPASSGGAEGLARAPTATASSPRS
eukprot:809951-Pyramimonas_sp.AAC.1